MSWRRLVEAAQEPARALEQAIGDPRTAQVGLLKSILAENATTEFGQKHDFAKLRTADEFRAAVPIQPYDAFRPLIERIANGESHVLTRDPVIAFEETGGTSGGGKLIPYTARSLAAFGAAVLPWLADLARRRPAAVAGSAYVSISPATRSAKCTASGIPIGLASEAAYLGQDLAEAFCAILAVPPQVGAIPDMEEWRLATLSHLVERDDLGFVSVWSPTFFLELIEALPSHADRLVLSPAARKRLAQYLSRPAAGTTCLWPRLDTISCWTDASSAAFARRLASACPRAAIEPKGLMATEAAITLPWGGGAGGIPALNSAYLEFADANGRTRLADELAVGESLRVIVTTAGGLYRYDMGDRVRCVGHIGATPRLVFEGRADLVSDMVGEKLNEAFVARALAALGVAAALAPRSEPKPHYELWLDAEQAPEQAGERIDAALRGNPQYAYARDLGQLGPVIALARPGFSARRNEERARAGWRLGDMKPAAIVLEG